MKFNHTQFLQNFSISSSKEGQFYSLPQLEEAGIGEVSRLPVCLRIVLESLLRNYDGKKIVESDIKTLASWQPNAERTAEIPLIVARVLLQDFTGVPLGVDLAAMRSAVAQMEKSPSIIEPLVPVDLIIDHSVQVDFANQADAFQLNLDMEFKRNNSRYQFLKWCMKSFNSFNVIPPGIGICHQVNLEYLAQGVLKEGEVYYPDTLVGTDSHTTMINGLGVLGWGVGGIEAEAAMLGQPVYLLTPDVVGVHMKGKLREGVTATDLVLSITELLRKTKVVGKFVEFHGEGASSLPVPDRATIANMAPEYGATIGFFPIDERTCEYLLATGRSQAKVDAFRSYYIAQKMFGIPHGDECQYSNVVEIDLAEVVPAIAGPKRPQDRIALENVKQVFLKTLQSQTAAGYGKPANEIGRKFRISKAIGAVKPRLGGGDQQPDTLPMGSGNQSTKDTSILTEIEMMTNRPTPDPSKELLPEVIPTTELEIAHGDVLIAAITSCTNTSNPSVMLGAGLVAKKAVERGLTVNPKVKTSLAPGSRAVTEYFEKTGLQHYLNELGFILVGYGCTTCIGNSGPLAPAIEELLQQSDIVAASVLSGNRNFEARVHQSIKANFLMSPPLVVAYALAGNVLIDLMHEPLGKDKEGKNVYLKEIWPTLEEINAIAASAFDPNTYQQLYSNVESENQLWNEIPDIGSEVYEWDRASTYIQEPPYFEGFTKSPQKVADIIDARPLAIFGDSVTTDHISPAGAIKNSSAAGVYLQERGVAPLDFNSYGSRRGNHEVMVRGTFANVRIKNFMVPGTEGGVTIYYPNQDQMGIYEASIRYQSSNVPLVVIAGQEYGTGSSRDWAAKGTKLLGVRAVIAQSFERIHRSNLVGMGILPCQFLEGDSAASLEITGAELFSLKGLENSIAPRQNLSLSIKYSSGEEKAVPVILRLDSPIEVDYYRHGGILPYVLRQLI
ncbi:MAG: aconitate hydratase [Chroococcidiopsidaceae cyanobacterium CP_BM_RX_35]|nr:aconitate hydratase [Chroococcidiopsidaceae cyanobacterium CP_BM_RX_35]